MPTLKPLHRIAIALAFAVLMGITRYAPIGSMMGLPDASLAVFFLAGAYLAAWGIFPIYLTLAGLMDYLAIAYGGVSAWCVSPAYPFLIPTYGCLWLAGRWYRLRHADHPRTLLPLGVSVLISASVAFFVSNASFYVFSERFSGLDWYAYAVQVTHHYVPYIWTAFAYVAVGALMHGIALALMTDRSARTA